MNKAIILLSGGIDSTTCLALAKAQGYECYALSFDYGQKHKSELEAAKNIAKIFQVAEHKIFKIPAETFNSSALINKSIEVPNHTNASAIPNTYVPARNTIFLSIALGWAEVIGAYDIFHSANAIDYAHYPDCRPEYIAAFEKLANLATKAGVEGKHFKIQTPLVTWSKAEIIQAGINLGIDYALTVTCYQADELGRACGDCYSCTPRKQGFAEASIKDPTRYACHTGESRYPG